VTRYVFPDDLLQRVLRWLLLLAIPAAIALRFLGWR
jgi:hypothetical protein